MNDSLKRLEAIITRIDSENDWNECRLYVLKELVRLDIGQERIEAKLETALTNAAALKVQAGVLGAIAGSVPSIVAVVWILLTR
jgi:hypothetical protein